MLDTVGNGTRLGEPWIVRAVGYAVEALAFAGTLAVVYAVWG
ncbi:hypothetical protein ACFOWE_01895 [Planomonospora corallina]|uniref:Uncharacterized protein n=1 Tax=Planomonospora corallina TaxID=1806052 RepID=A0ABV8I3R6_9ACTN